MARAGTASSLITILPRIVSRWGDDGIYRVESAKMLAAMLHGVEGTPYIYQGEALGMTNIGLPIEQYVDIETHNIYNERTAQGYDPKQVMASIHARSRDNSRTPMQRNAEENAGFTTGTPWIPADPNYRSICRWSAISRERRSVWMRRRTSGASRCCSATTAPPAAELRPYEAVMLYYNETE